MKQKTVILIVGPTAAGKTSLAIDLARHFKTDIISADSRQCYKELNIGVSKPTVEELNDVRHYFINSHSIHDDVNAAVFEKYSLLAAYTIFKKHDVAILVGGTGLYIKAFCEGLDEIPAVPQEIRSAVISGFKLAGIEWLQKEINEYDPGYYDMGEIKNPRRLMRALEVKMATGKSILEFQQNKKNERDFQIIKMGLGLTKEELYRNIHHRVDLMTENGLLEEVISLLPWRNLNALRTVGYTELFNYLDGGMGKEEAINLIKKNSRLYAKRQLTWFRKDPSITWVAPGAAETIINHFYSVQ